MYRGPRLLVFHLFRPEKHFHRYFFPLVAASKTVLVRRLDERRKQRMRLQRLRLELGMELAAQEVGVVGNLDDLDVGAVGRCAADAQSACGKRALVLAVELVPMAMTLADLVPPVRLVRQGAGLKLAGPCAQTHRSTQLFHPAQLAQLVNDAMRGRWIKLTRVRLLESADIARKLDARRLHPQAYPEEWHLVFARVLDSLQHALNAALAKAAGHQDSVSMLQLRLHTLVLGFQPLGFDPIHVQL